MYEESEETQIEFEEKIANIISTLILIGFIALIVVIL